MAASPLLSQEGSGKWIHVSTALVASAITLVLGTALPILSGPKVSSALINVIWGSVYGLGFWAISALPYNGPGLIGTITTVFGMILWPLAVVYGVFRFTLYIFKLSKVVIICSLFLFILTLAWNVQISRVSETFIFYMPIYSAFLDR